MKVSVFGLGYVGAVCCACFSDCGHEVIGIDVNQTKVDLINSGKSPIVEPGLEEMIGKFVAKGTLKASTDIYQAVLDSDVSLISVGTPSKASGDLELDYVERVCEQIAEALKAKDSYHLVIVRSTVLPGTCSDLVVPVLEKFSGKKLGTDFGVAMNPEFLRESTAVYDFYYPPMIVIGQMNDKDGDMVEALYPGIEAPILRRDIEVAEMIKYTCNIWHAVKVSFANEVGAIAKALDVDGRQVMDVVCEDKKLNISSYYMKPGYSFGGSCLPKDVRAMNARSMQLNVTTPLISSLMSSNAATLHRGFQLVRQTGKRKIGLLGLSFKADTDDLRESPLVDLAELLIGKGYEVAIYDNNVHYASIYGSNKDYINQHIPHLSALLNESLDEVVNGAELLIVGNGNKAFKALANQPPEGKQVLDLVGLMENASNEQAQGICW